MGEAKPIASLSGLLLARKGAARPAMRRPTANGNGAGFAQDDLGWNDMGYDVDPAPNAPMDYEHDSGYNSLSGAVPEVKPEVRQLQERIAEQLHVQAEAGFESVPELPVAVEVTPIAVAARPQPVKTVSVVKSKARAAPGSKEKAAFTLRLDAERHLKLRLACAVNNRSAQMLVTDALDAFLDAMPEIGQLAARVPAR